MRGRRRDRAWKDEGAVTVKVADEARRGEAKNAEKIDAGWRADRNPPNLNHLQSLCLDNSLGWGCGALWGLFHGARDKSRHGGERVGCWF